MEIVTTDGTASAGASAMLASATGRTEILGKEDFLKLLTVQLSHQDPLNPVSNEAFVAQLAQFSSLEQMQNMAQSLEASQLLDQSINNSLAVGLIGRVVRTGSDGLSLEANAPAEFTVALADGARATVTIRDASGAVVRTLDLGRLPAGENRVLWDGKDDAGQALAAGEYRLAVEALDAEGRPVAARTTTTGEVTGLRFANGRTLLIVNGREVPLDEVAEIRSAGDGQGR
jgi:flagellar basal-body rod modification protein FlgD